MTLEPLAAPLERALVRFRLQTAHNLLDEAFGAAPADVVARELVLPVFERLEQAGDAGVVRFAVSVFEIRMLVQARGWERIEGPQVTLACAPREERTLALITLGLGLAARHCRIDYLGAATPTTALHGGVIVVHADADDLDPREREDLRALRVVLTGRAAPGLAAALDLPALALDPAAALEQAASLAHRSHPARGTPPHPLTADHQPDRMTLLYEIRIKGRVGDHLADALGLDAEVEPVDTILRGPVEDQEGLHALLARMQDMGLELVEIRQLPPP